jgi:hypothetical protein
VSNALISHLTFYTTAARKIDTDFWILADRAMYPESGDTTTPHHEDVVRGRTEDDHDRPGGPGVGPPDTPAGRWFSNWGAQGLTTHVSGIPFSQAQPRSRRRGPLLGGSAVGIASAQTAPAAATPQAGQTQPGYQAFVDALAKRLGISSTTLQTAIGQARTDVGLPATGGFGPGHGGPDGPGRGPRGFGRNLESAATAIGIPVSQLQQELPGKSLAQVAQAHGKNPADVATALKNAAHQRIDRAVAFGRLTADEATQQKQREDQRIDQQMTQVTPAAVPAA